MKNLLLSIAILSSPQVFGQQAGQTIGNLSLRGSIGPSTQLISGFVISGPSRANILIRGAGPALTPYGVLNPIQRPLLTLYNARGEKIAINDGWTTRPDSEHAAIGRAGVTFPFSRNSNDCGMVVSLEPGLYTAELSSLDGSSGVGLIELFQDGGFGTIPQSETHFVNVSNRCFVDAGEAIAIAGSNLPRNRRLLIRAIGPSLTQFGVDGVLKDPRLEIIRPPITSILHGGVSTIPAVMVTSNDDWTNQLPLTYSFDPATGVRAPIVGVSWSGTTEDIEAAATKVGAFRLARESKEAAMLVTIDWAPLTIHVSDANGGAGVVLIEIYDVEGT